MQHFSLTTSLSYQKNRILLVSGYWACDETDLVLSSRTNRATKSVIHQKNRLRMNQTRKPCPFWRATEAGHSAIVTHKNRTNTVQITENVYPKILKTIQTPYIIFLVYKIMRSLVV